MTPALRLLAIGLIGGAVLGLGCATASADGIDFTGNDGNLTGTGNGTPVLGVLSLQQQGNGDTEWGWSGWDGNDETWSTSTSQVHKNTTPSGYYARSVGELASFGIDEDNLALVFQVNMAGQTDEMQVTEFELVFYEADGTEAFRLCYEPSGDSLAGTDIGGTDDGTLPGVGQGTSGWLYILDSSVIDAQDWADFWADDDSRIGMFVSSEDPFGDVNDGSDNFWLTSVDAAPIPEPGTLALFGLSAAGLALRRRRRQRNA